MERRKFSPKELFLKNKRMTLAGRGLLGLVILTGGLSALACSEKASSTDDGYLNRSVLHTVANPLNGDKYTTFEFTNRDTQAKSQVDFHHLKGNPQKYERVLANIEGLQKSILSMEQENIPLGRDIEFQHSTIKLLNSSTGKEEVLQINRVKPTSEDAPRITAYSLFAGDKNPTHLGTILISDLQRVGGERGENFVVLKPGTFDFDQTTERYSNSYIQKADRIMEDLRQRSFQDPRVEQAVWETEDERGFFDDNKHIIKKGIISGVPYEIRSQYGGEEIPGHHLFGKTFKSSEIIDGNGNIVAKISTNHYKGFRSSNGESLNAVVYTFSTFKNGKEKVVMETKRYFEDKSETMTSRGTGTTIGFSASGGMVVGWTSVDLLTPVNYQDVHTFLYSFGKRDDNLSEEQIEENRREVSAIFTLLGGASITDGLNFQDSEIEWKQSSLRVINGAQKGNLTTGMGFWLELPVDATPEGQAEALKLLTSK